MCQEILENYMKKLGISITLEQLVESHEYLREKYIQTNKEINETVQRIVTDRLRTILTEDYIRVDKLKNMSISEICDLYCEED